MGKKSVLDLGMECGIHFSFSKAAFLDWAFLRLVIVGAYEEIRTCGRHHHRRIVSLERSELGVDGAWDLRGSLSHPASGSFLLPSCGILMVC
jgi:hypothetical protein